MMTSLLPWLATLPGPAAAPRASLASAAPARLVEAAGVEIAVTDPGAGAPALLCLHAVGHGAGDFDGLRDQLGDTVRLITLDWPGHGASANDTVPASAERYAVVLGAVLDTLELDSVVLLGNSIGGAAAITIAAERPHQVRALVLADTGGLDRGGWLARSYIHGVARRFERGARGDPGFAGWYERYYRPILPGAPERRAQIVAAGPQMASVLGQAWRSFATPQADLRPLLAGLRQPIWIAWARHDRVIRWSRNRAALAGHEPSFFEGGHSPFLEDPDAFALELRAFLAGLPPTAP